MTPLLDLTWVGDAVQRHQPHGWAMLAAVALFVLSTALVGVCIGDDT